MAMENPLAQSTGLGKSSRLASLSSTSDDAVKTYLDEVIHLFLSDLAAQIKSLRRKARSRASKTIIQFFQTLAKSPQPLHDLRNMEIDALRDFGDFLYSVSQTLKEELLSGHLKSHDTLNQNLEPTAQFLNESLAALESRKDIIKILSDYVAHASSQSHDAFLSAPVHESVPTPSISEVSTQAHLDKKRTKPFFVKETFNPDFGFRLESLFSAPVASYKAANGHSKPEQSKSSGPSDAALKPSVTRSAVEQFLQYIAEATEMRAQRENFSPLIARTFSKLAQAPDVFSELAKLNFIAGLQDFTDFLYSQRQRPASALSRSLAGEVAQHLIGLFKAALSEAQTVAQLTDYLEGASEEIDDALSLLDVATPPPTESVELPKVDPTALTRELEPEVPLENEPTPTEPTESEYIGYVTQILTRVHNQVSRESSGYEQIASLLNSPDLLVSLSQTEHEWLKEFAHFIGESWSNRVPIEKLNALADDIVASLASALSAQTRSSTDPSLDTDLDDLLSSLKPLPLSSEPEELPTIPAETLENITHEIEETISLPELSTETQETSSSDTLDDFGLPKPSDEIITSEHFELPTPEDHLAAELSDALSSLADTDSLDFQMDMPEEEVLPDYFGLATEVLRTVQLTLPRTDAGKFAFDFFDRLLTADDLLGALQTSPLSSIRDIGNFILSANQSRPTEEIFTSRLMTKANEAIGSLFAEFERQRAAEETADDLTFSPADFLEDEPEASHSETPSLPSEIVVPVFPNAKHDIAPPTDPTDELDVLPEQLFDNLNLLADAPLLEPLSTADTALDEPVSSMPQDVTSDQPSASVSQDFALDQLETPTSLQASTDELLTLKELPELETSLDDTTLLTSEPTQSTVTTPPSSPTDATSGDDLIFNTDLLASEFLLDESLLSDASLEQADTQKSALSSLHDLSSKTNSPDDLSEQHLGDSLLTLDDSAFLGTETLLDDTPSSSATDIALPSSPTKALDDAAPAPDTTLDFSAELASDNTSNLLLDEDALHADTLSLPELDDVSALPVTPSAQPQAAKFVPDELQQIFLEEATEYLEKLNEDLLELDKVADTQQPELVNRVLRGSHTIKGSAAMVQLKNISDLAHKMEDSLQLVRDKNLKASKILIDVLFKSADVIGDMLKTFRATGKDDHPQKDNLVAILKNYTEQLEKFGEIRTVLSLSEMQTSKAIETVEASAQQRRTQSVAEQTVRIDIRALNNLVNLSAELVIARNRLNNELLAFNKAINRFNKERSQLAQISKKVMTMIQKGSKESGALASYSDVLKEFSETEFDRFSELDIISRDIKSAILNFDESISDLKSIGSLFNQNVVKVSNIANDLNREIVGMRMVPVKQMFTRFSRSVRDIAKMEQKEINLVTEGEETKLDKTVMEDVIEPVMHIVRNAIGHGIETPDVRVAHGKSPVGTITLRAYQKGSRVILEVEDDGGGINIEKVKAKAIKVGLITPEEAEKMTPAQATELIFRPGFSTADKVTELQGRGVGMDVVQNTIRRLKGTTNIETVSGKGTKFIISLPLTLAIGDALLVTALDQTYAIPLEPVLETSYISTDIIEQDEDGKRYITLRDERIELRYLNDVLGYQSDVLHFKAKVAVVIIRLEEEQKKVAVAVEKLIGKEEIVVKTLGKHLRNVPGVIGSTILGDGQVIIILDIDYLLRSEESRSRDVHVSVDSAAAETIAVSTEPIMPTVKRRRRKGAKITVLHADDSPSVRKYVQSVLKTADITVISADDGLAALNRLPTSNADLVISDLEMPRMNGFELVSEIRKMPEYQDLPIIIVTARAGDKHRRTGLELGANAFLNKPFDPQQLIETIENFVS